MPERLNFTVATENVDPEIATAGSELVVPVVSGRYAERGERPLGFYDALYGTDAIPEEDSAQKGKITMPCAARRSSLGAAVPGRMRAARRFERKRPL